MTVPVCSSTTTPAPATAGLAGIFTSFATAPPLTSVSSIGLGPLMAKTRHRSPRSAMRYVRPSPDAVEDVTQLLDTAPPRRG